MRQYGGVVGIGLCLGKQVVGAYQHAIVDQLGSAAIQYHGIQPARIGRGRFHALQQHQGVLIVIGIGQHAHQQFLGLGIIIGIGIVLQKFLQLGQGYVLVTQFVRQLCIIVLRYFLLCGIAAIG